MPCRASHLPRTTRVAWIHDCYRSWERKRYLRQFLLKQCPAGAPRRSQSRHHGSSSGTRHSENDRLAVVEALTSGGESKLVQQAEATSISGSEGNVEVFLIGSMVTPIIEKPLTSFSSSPPHQALTLRADNEPIPDVPLGSAHARGSPRPTALRGGAH